MKIRSFHERAGVRAVPYGDEEKKMILQQAKQEYDENDGLLATDTYMSLGFAYGDTQRGNIIQLWDLMSQAEVDMEGIDPEENIFMDYDESAGV